MTPLETAHRFFGHLHPAAICPPGSVRCLWTRQDHRTYWYQVADTAIITQAAVRLSKDFDVYFGVGLQAHPAQRGSRGRADEVIAIPGLWLDVDIQGQAHKQGNLPRDLEEAVDWCRRFTLQPTMLVASGCGCHAYWLLDEPWLFETPQARREAQDLSIRFQAWFRQTERNPNGWHLDSTHDLTRILRVPGTMNRKGDPPVPVMILDDGGPRHSLEQFQALLPSPPPTTATVTARSRSSVRTSQAAAYSDRLEQATRFARAFPPSAQGDRNNQAFRLACSLGNDFSLGDSEEAWRLLSEWNARCAPPLEEQELGIVYSSALKGATYPEGCKLAPPWEPPEPLEEALPDFPTSALPEPIRAYVESASAAFQVPADLVAFAVLGALSAAAGNCFKVMVRPQWLEPVHLFLLVLLRTGERKSPVLSHVIQPLEAWERAARERTAQHNREIVPERRELQERLRFTRTGSPEPDVEKLRERLEGLEPQSSPRLLADDGSPEALAVLLQENGGSLALISAEADVLEIAAGRYSNGTANLGLLLRAYSGEPIRFDRIGRPPVHVEEPALTLALTVQPVVFEELCAKPIFRRRGLLGRFLYAAPRSMVGARSLDPPSIPGEVYAAYCDTVAGMLSLRSGLGSVLAFEDVGLPKPLAEFLERLESGLRPGGDLEDLEDWANKAGGQIVRLAALLHLAQNWKRPTVPISAETVSKAVALAEYLICHARAVYGLAAAGYVLADARYVLARLT